MTTRKPRLPKFLSEDITVGRMVADRNSDRVMVVPQVIRAKIITRIAESTEYPRATVIWIDGEEHPMTVDCPMDEFYQAWINGRINTRKNQAI